MTPKRFACADSAPAVARSVAVGDRSPASCAGAAGSPLPDVIPWTVSGQVAAGRQRRWKLWGTVDLEGGRVGSVDRQRGQRQIGGAAVVHPHDLRHRRARDISHPGQDRAIGPRGGDGQPCCRPASARAADAGRPRRPGGACHGCPRAPRRACGPDAAASAGRGAAAGTAASVARTACAARAACTAAAGATGAAASVAAPCGSARTAAAGRGSARTAGAGRGAHASGRRDPAGSSHRVTRPGRTGREQRQEEDPPAPDRWAGPSLAERHGAYNGSPSDGRRNMNAFDERRVVSMSRSEKPAVAVPAR